MEGIQFLDGAQTAQNTSKSGFADLTSDQFVKLMFAELSNQDPMKPNDSQALLDQLSSLRSIESDRKLGERLDQMVEQNDFGTASRLIGRVISGITLQSEQVIDSVFSVSKTMDGPILNLTGGQQIRLDDVIEIANNQDANMV